MLIWGLVLVSCLMFIDLFILGYAILYRKFWWGILSFAWGAYVVWLGMQLIQCLVEFGM